MDTLRFAQVDAFTARPFLGNPVAVVLGADGMISIEALADTYWMLHTQQRSAWTLELDLRPYKEQF